MRKGMCLLCAALMSLLSATAVFSAEQADGAPDGAVYADVSSLSTAAMLVDNIMEKAPFSGETVTRGEFADAVTKLMKVYSGAGLETPYSDVPLSHKYAAAVSCALKLGWIATAESFKPDAPVQVGEAVKITVSAVGYAARAEAGLGYPAGYLNEARRLGLLDGIKTFGNELRPEQAKLLVYNMLNVRRTDSTLRYDGDGYIVSYDVTGQTILNALYDIRKIKGIINATAFNAFEYDADIRKDQTYIEIGGEVFSYADAAPDLLGLAATAFFQDNDGSRTIIALKTGEENETVRYDLSELEYVDQNLIEYTDKNEKTKKLRLSGAVFVYNGRTLSRPEKDDFDRDGFALFIDNDKDGQYEIVQITAYRYMIADAIDRFGRKIGDVNATSDSLDLSVCEEDWLRVYDKDGNEISFYSIAKGAVFQAVIPKDTRFATLDVISEQISGTVEEVGEDFLTIDGTRFSYSKYFEEHYLDGVTVGRSGGYYVGYHGILICPETETSEYEYGFLLGAERKKELDAFIDLKLFTESGGQRILRTTKNIFIDGERMSAVEAYRAYLSIIISDELRLIRYQLNSAGEVSGIDTAVEYDYKTHEQQIANEDNRLVYYPNYKNSLRYRSGAKVFTGDIALGAARCFMIPKDLSEDEIYFRSGDASALLKHDSTYVPYVYDIDGSGFAGIIVVRDKDEEMTLNDESFIVDSVTRGIDGEGEIVSVVRCWSKGSYHAYYLPDDVVVTKDSKENLEPGDIIRVKIDGKNRVYSIRVDFDYGAFAKSSSLLSANDRNRTGNISYWMGLAFSLSPSGAMLQIAAQKNGYGEYDLSQYALNTLSVNTTNVVRFNCANKQMRPIAYDEIKTYKTFENGCDYAVIRSNYDSPAMVVLYDNHAEQGGEK